VSQNSLGNEQNQQFGAKKRKNATYGEVLYKKATFWGAKGPVTDLRAFPSQN